MVIFYEPVISYHHPIHVLSIYADFSFWFAVENYAWLVNGTAQARIEKFMEEEFSFSELTKVAHLLSLIYNVHVIDLFLPH